MLYEVTALQGHKTIISSTEQLYFSIYSMYYILACINSLEKLLHSLYISYIQHLE